MSTLDLELRIRVSQDKKTLTFSVRSDILDLHEKDFGATTLDLPPDQFFTSFFRDFENTNILSHNPGVGEINLKSSGRVLFGLMPRELRNLLWENRDKLRTLQILSDEPWIPWELASMEMEMEKGTQDGLFLAEQFEVSRWLCGRSAPQYLSLNRVAMVMPEDPITNKFARLRLELKKMLQMVGQTTEIPTNVLSILEAMAKGRFDAWYFYGHGRIDDDPDQSVFSLDQGDLLKPRHISGEAADMGHKRPLIFLNSCQGGRTGFSLTGMGGWAARFHGVGAGAFVGAYWPIPAGLAAEFALRFFTLLIEGQPVAKAFREARLAIRTPGDPTWLAFTLFAAPHATLRTQSSCGLQEFPSPLKNPINQPVAKPLTQGNLPTQKLSKFSPWKITLSLLLLLLLVILTHIILSPPAVKEAKIRIAFLDFSRWDAMEDIPYDEMARISRETFKMALAQAGRFEPGVAGVVYDTLPNTPANVQRLLEIMRNVEYTQGEKMELITTELMAPYDIDVLVTGLIVKGKALEYADWRVMAILREQQRFEYMDKRLGLSLSELVCENPESGLISLCQNAEDEIAHSISRFFLDLARRIDLFKWEFRFSCARESLEWKEMGNIEKQFRVSNSEIGIPSKWTEDLEAFNRPFNIFWVDTLLQPDHLLSPPLQRMLNKAVFMGTSQFAQKGDRLFSLDLIELGTIPDRFWEDPCFSLLLQPTYTIEQKSRIAATVLRNRNLDIVISSVLRKRQGIYTLTLMVNNRYGLSFQERGLNFSEDSFFCDDVGAQGGRNICRGAMEKIAHTITDMLARQTGPLLKIVHEKEEAEHTAQLH